MQKNVSQCPGWSLSAQLMLSRLFMCAFSHQVNVLFWSAINHTPHTAHKQLKKQCSNFAL